MSAGRSDEAGKEFRRAVELGPGVPESWLTYVQYLVQVQADRSGQDRRRGRAASLARRSGDPDPGQVLLLLGDAQRAEELIGKALNRRRSSPTIPPCSGLRPSWLSSQNRFDKVNDYLEQARSQFRISRQATKPGSTGSARPCS